MLIITFLCLILLFLFYLFALTLFPLPPILIPSSTSQLLFLPFLWPLFVFAVFPSSLFLLSLSRISSHLSPLLSSHLSYRFSSRLSSKGCKPSKPKSIQMSNWSSRTLSESQITYAALDAVMGRDIYDHIASTC